MLKYRVLSAVIGIPLLALIFNLGGTPFLVLNIAVVSLGINEYFNLIKTKFEAGDKKLAILGGLILITSVHLSLELKRIYLILNLMIIVLFLRHIFKAKIKGAILNTAITYFAFFYIAGLFSHLLLLARLDLGSNLHNQLVLWLPLLATWAADTGAYFSGLSLGRRALAPKISPNKTIEGAMGGLFSSIVVTLIISIYLGFGYLNGIMLGVLIGVFAQLGDLSVSILKRDAEVKDSGDLIPGHGGLLDRIDSLLFSIPIAYYYIQLIILG